MARPSPKAQAGPPVDDQYLVALAKQGNAHAYDRIVRRYHGFVRLKASSYFLTGGDADDLIQEGLVGLYKAVRDYRSDRESSFRNFAELCITRQIITAVKTATRNKHSPLNGYVSFSSSPASSDDGEPTLDDVLPGPSVHDPVNQVISSEELRSLVGCLSSVLSPLESRVLALYLDGHAYEVIGQRLGCDAKTVDNALQRVKRKVGAHLAARAVPSLGLGMSTVLIVVLVLLAVVVLLAVGGYVANTRRQQQRERSGEFSAELDEANRSLADAYAADRGWEPEALEAAAREGFGRARPGEAVRGVDLVEVIDRPGIEDDQAVYRVLTSDGEARVRLGRRGGRWVAEAVE